MKINSKAGSKQRLLEMMMGVNKITLTEAVIPVGTKIPLKGLTIDKLGFDLRPQTSRKGVQYQVVGTQELFPSANEGDVDITISTDLHFKDWQNKFYEAHGDDGFLVKISDRKWDVVGNNRFSQWRDEYTQNKASAMDRDAQRGFSTESVVQEDSEEHSARQDLRQLQRDEDNRTFSSIVFMQGEEANEPLEILNSQGEKAALNYLMQWDMADSHDTSVGSRAGRNDDQYQEGNYLMSWNDRIGYIGLERIEDSIKEADDDSGYSYDRTHPSAHIFQEPELLPLEGGEEYRYIVLMDDTGRSHFIMIPVDSYEEHLDQLYRHFGTNSRYQEIQKKADRNYELSTDILGTNESDSYNYKESLKNDLKYRGQSLKGGETIEELENQDGLFKETYDSIVDYDKAYLDNSQGTEDTNVSKYDGGLNYPAEKDLRVNSNLIHQEPINEFDYNQEEIDQYNQMELDSDMEDFKPLTFNYDQKGNWIPIGHESKLIGIRVVNQPMGSSNEKNLIVKLKPDGGVEKVLESCDSWEQGKEEIKKYL